MTLSLIRPFSVRAIGPPKCSVMRPTQTRIRRVCRVLTAGRQDKPAAGGHIGDLIPANLIPLPVGTDDGIGRGNTADQRDLIAVLLLALAKISL